MGLISRTRSLPALAGLEILIALCTVLPALSRPGEELWGDNSECLRRGGRLIVGQPSEPRTLNPLIAMDTVSREIIELTSADLLHINRGTLRVESALAESWEVSPDRRNYTLHLRPGLCFSDGHPMDADDVVFTFRVYLDENIAASQRDLLIVDGKPIRVDKLDPLTVRFEMTSPYAAAERLFDSIAILPRHLLSKAYEEGRLNRAWSLSSGPDRVAGLGAFRLKEYVPGQRLVVERNPYFWKLDREGHRLPYLDEIVFLFLPSEEVRSMRLLAGTIDLVSPVSADDFISLRRNGHASHLRLYDAGPGLEYNFLVFNMTGPEKPADGGFNKKQRCFNILAFRQAVSAAIDREAIVRLAYRGLADPLWGPVTPGNRLWTSPALPRPPRSIDHARALLQSAAFSWREDRLLDPWGNPVEFSIMTNGANSQRSQAAAIVQQDLEQLGMTVSVVSLELRTMLNHLSKHRDFEAAILQLSSGDADPNSDMNVWLSRGSMHLWNLTGAPQNSWEKEIDLLMRRQMTASPFAERKRNYDRVQELISANQPITCLVSPHVLVGATDRLGNFQPAIMRPYALWNADTLYFPERATNRR